MYLEPKDLVRFWSKVDVSATCWTWKAGKKTDGYGQFSIKNKNITAHRFSYELFNGEIPEGLQLDHLCRNRACVNPSHLEAVTLQVNVQRGLTGKINNWEKSKQFCKRGHELKEPNLLKSSYKNGQGRRCRECNKICVRRRTQIKKGIIKIE